MKKAEFQEWRSSATTLARLGGFAALSGGTGILLAQVIDKSCKNYVEPYGT